MINAQDIKNGTCIRMDGKLYFCIEIELSVHTESSISV